MDDRKGRGGMSGAAGGRLDDESHCRPYRIVCAPVPCGRCVTNTLFDRAGIDSATFDTSSKKQVARVIHATITSMRVETSNNTGGGSPGGPWIGYGGSRWVTVASLYRDPNYLTRSISYKL